MADDELSHGVGEQPKFVFGLDKMDVVSAIADLSSALLDGSAIVQKFGTSVDQTQGDYEMKTITVTYAERIR